MKQLLAAGPDAARALAAGIVERAAKDNSRAMSLVFALLDAQPEPQVLSALLLDAAVTQWKEGFDRTADTVVAIGVAFRIYLGGELGNEVSPERARAIVHALLDSATDARVEHAIGLGVTASIAACGSLRGDPSVARFMANGARVWPGIAGDSAVHNLGHLVSPREYLAYVPWPSTPPTDPEGMSRHSSYVAGLMQALRRHPEQAGEVLPYISGALRRWNSNSLEIASSLAVLKWTKEGNVREAAPLRRELQQGTDRQLATRAAQILEEWK